MTQNFILKIAVTGGYIAMITVNYLANALPIGGVTTGDASDNFSNLFTPAGVTFSIWGLIYLFLFGYVLYQWGIWQKNRDTVHNDLLTRLNYLFLATSIANIAWIFAWHHGILWLSVLVMLSLLFLLIKIADVINGQQFSRTEILLVRVPFSMYFGWITVATIANISVFLVSIDWNGWGIADVMWTVIILIVGAVIGVVRMWKDQNIFYGAVLVWAYGGIWLKHASMSGFDGQYPSVIITAIACIVCFCVSIGVVFTRQHEKVYKK